MEIKVTFFASFCIGRFKNEIRDYPPGATIGQIVEELQLSERSLGVILLNGTHSTLEQSLNEGDKVSLLPLVGGG